MIFSMDGTSNMEMKSDVPTFKGVIRGAGTDQRIHPRVIPLTGLIRNTHSYQTPDEKPGVTMESSAWVIAEDRYQSMRRLPLIPTTRPRLLGPFIKNTYRQGVWHRTRKRLKSLSDLLNRSN